MSQLPDADDPGWDVVLLLDRDAFRVRHVEQRPSSYLEIATWAVAQACRPQPVPRSWEAQRRLVIALAIARLEHILAGRALPVPDADASP